MSFTLADIDGLRKQHDPITVGELPDVVRVALGLPLCNVHLSRESLRHINMKHPDITDFDLLLAPLAISRGTILREIDRPHIILSFYFDPESGRAYQATMKLAERGLEIWLCSFYRKRKRDYKKLLKRGTVLRAAAR